MKFDPFSWEEVNTNVQIEVGKGRVQLLVSQAAPVYVEAQGVEALAGVGTSHDLEVSEEVKIRIESPKGVRAFLLRPASTTAVEPIGEVYTNADRMTQESGTMAEITKARRLFEMERRAMLRDMKIETAKLKAEMQKARHVGSVDTDTPLDSAEAVVQLDDTPPADEAKK